MGQIVLAVTQQFYFIIVSEQNNGTSLKANDSELFNFAEIDYDINAAKG